MVSANNEHDNPNYVDEVANARTPNTNVENEESQASVVQDNEQSTNGGQSSTSIQNHFLSNIMKRTISQKLKDNCNANHFKNLSIFEEDNSDYESASFDEYNSAESRPESELDDCSDEPKSKISVKEDCSCAPKRDVLRTAAQSIRS